MGAGAYFILQGILRPTILKWASAPRFLFCLCRRGAGGKILLIMEDRLVAYAQAVIDSYNAGNESAIRSTCWTLNLMVHKHPAEFIKTKNPYLVSVALYYGLKEGVCFGEKSVQMAYYCMLRAYRMNNIHDSVAVSMYAFLLLDANIGILLPTLLVSALDGVETALGTVLGQLTAFYWTFTKSEESIVLDSQSMKLLKNRIEKYKKILNFDQDKVNIIQLMRTMNQLSDKLISLMTYEWETEQERQEEMFEADFDRY